MISDHAHSQNKAKRKELEGLGYRFSIGHDGWTVWLQDETVGQGVPTAGTKGDQKTYSCLDLAVHAATKHNNGRAIVTSNGQKKKEDTIILVKDNGLKVVDAPILKPSSKLQRKQVEAAINLLVAAGAQYFITLGDETFGEPPARERRDNYRDFYKPLLDPFKGKGPFTTTLQVPEDLDFAACTSTIKAYLRNAYGSGNAIMENDKASRTTTILVENAPFTEEE